MRRSGVCVRMRTSALLALTAFCCLLGCGGSLRPAFVRYATESASAAGWEVDHPPLAVERIALADDALTGAVRVTAGEETVGLAWLARGAEGGWDLVIATPEEEWEGEWERRRSHLPSLQGDSVLSFERLYGVQRDPSGHHAWLRGSVDSHPAVFEARVAPGGEAAVVERLPTYDDPAPRGEVLRNYRFLSPDGRGRYYYSGATAHTAGDNRAPLACGPLPSPPLGEVYGSRAVSDRDDHGGGAAAFYAVDWSDRGDRPTEPTRLHLAVCRDLRWSIVRLTRDGHPSDLAVHLGADGAANVAFRSNDDGRLELLVVRPPPGGWPGHAW